MAPPPHRRYGPGSEWRPVESPPAGGAPEHAEPPRPHMERPPGLAALEVRVGALEREYHAEHGSMPPTAYGFGSRDGARHAIVAEG